MNVVWLFVLIAIATVVLSPHNDGRIYVYWKSSSSNELHLTENNGIIPTVPNSSCDQLRTLATNDSRLFPRCTNIGDDAYIELSQNEPIEPVQNQHVQIITNILNFTCLILLFDRSADRIPPNRTARFVLDDHIVDGMPPARWPNSFYSVLNDVDLLMLDYRTGIIELDLNVNNTRKFIVNLKINSNKQASVSRTYNVTIRKVSKPPSSLSLDKIQSIIKFHPYDYQPLIGTIENQRHFSPMYYHLETDSSMHRSFSIYRWKNAFGFTKNWIYTGDRYQDKNQHQGNAHVTGLLRCQQNRNCEAESAQVALVKLKDTLHCYLAETVVRYRSEDINDSAIGKLDVACDPHPPGLSFKFKVTSSKSSVFADQYSGLIFLTSQGKRPPSDDFNVEVTCSVLYFGQESDLDFTSVLKLSRMAPGIIRSSPTFKCSCRDRTCFVSQRQLSRHTPGVLHVMNETTIGRLQSADMSDDQEVLKVLTCLSSQCKLWMIWHGGGAYRSSVIQVMIVKRPQPRGGQFRQSCKVSDVSTWEYIKRACTTFVIQDRKSLRNVIALKRYPASGQLIYDISSQCFSGADILSVKSISNSSCIKANNHGQIFFTCEYYDGKQSYSLSMLLAAGEKGDSFPLIIELQPPVHHTLKCDLPLQGSPENCCWPTGGSKTLNLATFKDVFNVATVKNEISCLEINKKRKTSSFERLKSHNPMVVDVVDEHLTVIARISMKISRNPTFVFSESVFTFQVSTLIPNWTTFGQVYAYTNDILQTPLYWLSNECNVDWFNISTVTGKLHTSKLQRVPTTLWTDGCRVCAGSMLQQADSCVPLYIEVKDDTWLKCNASEPVGFNHNMYHVELSRLGPFPKIIFNATANFNLTAECGLFRHYFLLDKQTAANLNAIVVSDDGTVKLMSEPKRNETKVEFGLCLQYSDNIGLPGACTHLVLTFHKNLQCFLDAHLSCAANVPILMLMSGTRLNIPLMRLMANGQILESKHSSKFKLVNGQLQLAQKLDSLELHGHHIEVLSMDNRCSTGLVCSVRVFLCKPRFLLARFHFVFVDRDQRFVVPVVSDCNRHTRSEPWTMNFTIVDQDDDGADRRLPFDIDVESGVISLRQNARYRPDVVYRFNVSVRVHPNRATGYIYSNEARRLRALVEIRTMKPCVNGSSERFLKAEISKSANPGQFLFTIQSVIAIKNPKFSTAGHKCLHVDGYSGEVFLVDRFTPDTPEFVTVQLSTPVYCEFIKISFETTISRNPWPLLRPAFSVRISDTLQENSSVALISSYRKTTAQKPVIRFGLVYGEPEASKQTFAVDERTGRIYLVGKLNCSRIPRYILLVEARSKFGRAVSQIEIALQSKKIDRQQYSGQDHCAVDNDTQPILPMSTKHVVRFLRSGCYEIPMTVFVSDACLPSSMSRSPGLNVHASGRVSLNAGCLDPGDMHYVTLRCRTQMVFVLLVVTGVLPVERSRVEATTDDHIQRNRMQHLTSPRFITSPALVSDVVLGHVNYWPLSRLTNGRISIESNGFVVYNSQFYRDIGKDMAFEISFHGIDFIGDGWIVCGKNVSDCDPCEALRKTSNGSVNSCKVEKYISTGLWNVSLTDFDDFRAMFLIKSRSHILPYNTSNHLILTEKDVTWISMHDLFPVSYTDKISWNLLQHYQDDCMIGYNRNTGYAILNDSCLDVHLFAQAILNDTTVLDMIELTVTLDNKARHNLFNDWINIVQIDKSTHLLYCVSCKANAGGRVSFTVHNNLFKIEKDGRNDWLVVASKAIPIPSGRYVVPIQCTTNNTFHMTLILVLQISQVEQRRNPLSISIKTVPSLPMISLPFPSDGFDITGNSEEQGAGLVVIEANKTLNIIMPDGLWSDRNRTRLLIGPHGANYEASVVKAGIYSISIDIKQDQSDPVFLHSCPLTCDGEEAEASCKVLAIDPDGGSISYSIHAPFDGEVMIDKNAGTLKWYDMFGQENPKRVIVQAVDEAGKSALCEVDIIPANYCYAQSIQESAYIIPNTARAVVSLNRKRIIQKNDAFEFDINSSILEVDTDSIDEFSVVINDPLCGSTHIAQMVLAPVTYKTTRNLIFSGSSFNISVREHTLPGSSVFAIPHYDEAELTVINGNDCLFTVSDWTLILLRDLNFERKNVQIITLEAAVGSYVEVATIHIHVDYANNFPTRFDQGIYQCHHDPQLDTDDQKSCVLTWRGIKASHKRLSFYCDHANIEINNQGHVSYTGPLFDTIVVQVALFDGRFVDHASLHINVEPIVICNPNPVRIYIPPAGSDDDCKFAWNLSEHFWATDRTTHEIQLISSKSKPFNWDIENGTILIAKERAKSQIDHMLQLSVGKKCNLIVMVKVASENNNRPIFSPTMPSHLNVSIGSPEINRPYLLTTITARDVDRGRNGLVAYFMCGRPDSKFYLDSATGYLYYTPDQLNDDDRMMYNICVRAADLGTPKPLSTTTHIVITVNLHSIEMFNQSEVSVHLRNSDMFPKSTVLDVSKWRLPSSFANGSQGFTLKPTNDTLFYLNPTTGLLVVMDPRQTYSDSSEKKQVFTRKACVSRSCIKIKIVVENVECVRYTTANRTVHCDLAENNACQIYSNRTQSRHTYTVVKGNNKIFAVDRLSGLISIRVPKENTTTLILHRQVVQATEESSNCSHFINVLIKYHRPVPLFCTDLERIELNYVPSPGQLLHAICLRRPTLIDEFLVAVDEPAKSMFELRLDHVKRRYGLYIRRYRCDHMYPIFLLNIRSNVDQSSFTRIQISTLRSAIVRFPWNHNRLEIRALTHLSYPINEFLLRNISDKANCSISLSHSFPPPSGFKLDTDDRLVLKPMDISSTGSVLKLNLSVAGKLNLIRLVSVYVKLVNWNDVSSTMSETDHDFQFRGCSVNEMPFRLLSISELVNADNGTYEPVAQLCSLSTNTGNILMPAFKLFHNAGFQYDDLSTEQFLVEEHHYASPQMGNDMVRLKTERVVVETRRKSIDAYKVDKWTDDAVTEEINATHCQQYNHYIRNVDKASTFVANSSWTWIATVPDDYQYTMAFSLRTRSHSCQVLRIKHDNGFLFVQLMHGLLAVNECILDDVLLSDNRWHDASIHVDIDNLDIELVVDTVFLSRCPLPPSMSRLRYLTFGSDTNSTIGFDGCLANVSMFPGVLESRQLVNVKQGCVQDKCSECNRLPCLNGGSCIPGRQLMLYNETSRRICVCLPRFRGDSCQVDVTLNGTIFRKSRAGTLLCPLWVISLSLVALIVGLIIWWTLFAKFVHCAISKQRLENSKWPASRKDNLSLWPQESGSRCPESLEPLLSPVTTETPANRLLVTDVIPWTQRTPQAGNKRNDSLRMFRRRR